MCWKEEDSICRCQALQEPPQRGSGSLAPLSTGPGALRASKECSTVPPGRSSIRPQGTMWLLTSTWHASMTLTESFALLPGLEDGSDELLLQLCDQWNGARMEI